MYFTGGLPLPDTEGNKDTKTLDYASTPLDANKLLAAGAMSHSSIVNLVNATKSK
ncbi:MAG: hypothetical protein ACK5NM_00680 [Cyclobacteriaceae bacterium]